MQRSKYSRDFT